MSIIKIQGNKEMRNGIYYEVNPDLEPLGEGGTGKVFEGVCVNMNTGETRPVAIKFIFEDHPEHIVERARREASVRIKNDNLIEMFGFVEIESHHDIFVRRHYHVVSELLHGVSLTDIFNGKCTDAKGREIPYARKLLNIYSKDPDHFARIIVMNVLSGLMALHDAGYIHRDIDPSNIMITEDEHIKLIDFGICKKMDKLTTQDNGLTKTGVFMGKPEYASPELALGDLKHQDQTTDIYAVGILLYQCILGHVPFEGTVYEILDNQIKQKIPAKKIKNQRLRKIVEKACNKKQELRYHSSAEMRVAIESLEREDEGQKRWIIAISVICVALLLLGGLIGGYYHRLQQKVLQQALIEKSIQDSLVLVVNKSVQQAHNLAQKGYLHDEGFDKYLIESKLLYDKADKAVVQLTNKNQVIDYSEDKAKLIKALTTARNELVYKASLLQNDKDPIVVEGIKVIRLRINEIEKVISH